MAEEHRKTLGDVVDQTLALCGDYRGQGLDGHWRKREEVRAVAKRAYLSLIREAGVLRGSAVIPIIDGEYIYDLPPDCLTLLACRANGIGASSTLILPSSAREIEAKGIELASVGSPINFLRDILNHHQIAFFPSPDTTGSSFARDSDYGLLRAIRDADGNYLPYDADQPIRDISGVPFMRSGDGSIIREVISPIGNIHVTYIRTPGRFEEDTDYPDNSIPVYLHKDFKFGVAEGLLKAQRDSVSEAKTKIYSFLWRRATNRAKADFAQTAHEEGVIPL
jgi:hypothetical protein